MDTCSATRRAGRELLICERPLRHDGDHTDGMHSWPNQSVTEPSRVIEGR